jgi:mannose-1-phosphate guanylyltransferase/mannose-6-phosphate isomerase
MSRGGWYRVEFEPSVAEASRPLEPVSHPRLFPVVISGGAGSRLWPLSTNDRPKQFHPLGSDRTLIQDTVLRLSGAAGLDIQGPILASNGRHLALIEEQMDEVGCKPAAIILEPFGRNTAPVAMAAALAVEAVDPGALVLLMPSDHVIGRPEAFAAAVAEAAPQAWERIILFGIKPTAPETGFGYIEAGEPLEGQVRAVARFVEKPDIATARSYLEGGRHLWNAGLFLFSPKVLIAEMERLAPDVASSVREALRNARRDGGVIELDAAAFEACPSISIDYAVMEHTDKAAVMPVDPAWADIGSWSSLWLQGPRDDESNVLRGDVEVLDVRDCLVWSQDRTVAVVGVSDLVVVQTEEAVLVLPKSRAQDVKLLVERMQARARGRQERP